MTKKSEQPKAPADKLVKSIRRETRQTYSSAKKIRIILAILRGEGIMSIPTSEVQIDLIRENERLR
jgi:transposase